MRVQGTVTLEVNVHFELDEAMTEQQWKQKGLLGNLDRKTWIIAQLNRALQKGMPLELRVQKHNLALREPIHGQRG